MEQETGNSELHVEQLATIAQVLLGVAYADKRFEAAEYDTIRAIMTEFTDIATLPPAVVAAIDGFDAAAFDVSAVLETLDVAPNNHVPLLRLVLRVADADKVREPSEEHYFHAVAAAIGASASDVSLALGG